MHTESTVVSSGDVNAALRLIIECVCGATGIHPFHDVEFWQGYQKFRVVFTNGNRNEVSREQIEQAANEIATNPLIKELIEECEIKVGEVKDSKNYPGQAPWQELELTWEAVR